MLQVAIQDLGNISVPTLNNFSRHLILHMDATFVNILTSVYLKVLLV